jgi:hypothetical protein
VNDKDLEEILPLFPKNAIYYFSKPNNPRGLDATILAEKARANDRNSIQLNYSGLPKKLLKHLRILTYTLAAVPL